MPLQTLFVGQNHVHMYEVDSTNTYAKEWLAIEQPAEGSLVTADAQLHGRGQAGNRWISIPGQNITASFILYPVFVAVDRQFALSMITALAVRELCEELTGRDFDIKWPNDIYHDRKKIAGILIENTISGQRIGTSVIGIGINVNQTVFDTALPNPISLCHLTGHELKLPDVLSLLCTYLEKYYLQLRQLHFHFIEKAYTESLFRFQQTAAFRSGDREFRGEIVGITREGKLIIQSAGRELKFGLKEVEYIL